MPFVRRPHLLAAVTAVTLLVPIMGVASAAAAARAGQSPGQSAPPSTTAPLAPPVAVARPGTGAGPSAATTVATTATGDARPDDEPDVLDRPRSGGDAERALGGNGSSVAARNKTSESRLRALLRSDRTLWLDRKGHAFYVDPIPVAAPSDPPVAAGPFPYSQTFLLHSKPGSMRTIYIDFDGATITNTAWNANFGIPANFSAGAYDTDGAPGTFNNTEMDVVQSVWQRVSEDYAPFDVDVTTQDPGLAALDRATAGDDVYGVHAIVTNSAALWSATCNSGCGGIAYIGAADLTAPAHEYYQPAIIFENGVTGAKNIAEATSHEVGHNFGLDHDGTASLAYYSGHGAWAPIMGVGYSHPIVQWSRGEYAGANNQQDDFAVMAGHGLPIRADDHGNSSASATTLATTGTAISGVISSTGASGDLDFFAITTGGAGSVSAVPASVAPNLDIRLNLYDAGGNLLASSDPPSAQVTVDTASGLGATVAIPTAGTFYVRVDGVGFGSPLDTGYSDYGSVGQYTISAAAPSPGTTLTISPTSVASGGVTNVSWTGVVAPSANDWIGLFVSSGTADGGYLAYRYTTGTASGSVPFTIPVGTPAGTTYQLRLFSNNTFARLAVSNTFAVTAAAAPTLTVTPTSIARGGVVTATWGAVPTPSATDWIGLYATSTSGDETYLAFRYTAGTASGNAELTVPTTLAAGTTYQLRLFSNNTYTRLATSAAFTVTAPAAPAVGIAPTSVARGGIAAASWSGIPSPRTTDWIGLYATSAAGEPTFLAYVYTSGSAAGSRDFNLPVTLAPGSTYELRLFSNNTYTRLATSAAFTVTAPAAPTLTVSPNIASPATILTASWTGIPTPRSTDWVGVYAQGAPDGSFLGYAYTSGATAGSLEINMPLNTLGGAVYELRLYSNNTYTRLATSNALSGLQANPPSVSVAPTSIAPGGTVSVSWNAIASPRASDWIGLYSSAAAPDSAFLGFMYVGSAYPNGIASGSLGYTVPIGTPAGTTYQFRLFSNGTFFRLASTSSFTVTAPAACTTDRGGNGTLPAEYATVVGGIAGVRCANTGFHGTGYIGDWTAETVTFRVNNPVEGRVNVRFRYQNASTDATRVLTTVNGSTSLTFHNTHGGDTSGNWANGVWSEMVVNVTLAAGANTITLGSGSGFVDLDEIVDLRFTGGLSGTLGGSNAPGTAYQAEGAALAGIQIGVLTTNPGYSGSGYVGNFGYVGNTVTFTNVAGGGLRTLRFRYRSADVNAQRLVSVNGSSVAVLPFANTGASWATAGWAEASVTVIVPSNATVTIEFLGDSGFGFIDLDQLTVAV